MKTQTVSILMMTLENLTQMVQKLKHLVKSTWLFLKAKSSSLAITAKERIHTIPAMVSEPFHIVALSAQSRFDSSHLTS